MNHRSRLAAASFAVSLTIGATAQADGIRPDQAAFRDIYKELVETNTSLSAGSCTAGRREHGRAPARRRLSRQRPAPVRDARASEGRRARRDSARHGSARRKPILLLAHIDVVEAKREDWERDPFKLVEENGYFYARGSLDDKSMAATWVDTLIRLRGERTKPRRTIKMALTCGEETSGAFNGAEYLVEREARPDRRRVRAQRRRVGHARRVGQARHDGRAGRREDLAELPPRSDATPAVTARVRCRTTRSTTWPRALTRIEHYEFPVKLNDTTRTYFTRMAGIVGGEMGAAMTKLVADPADAGRHRHGRPTIRLSTPCCARRAWRRCWTPVTQPTRCRSERGRT